MILNDAQLDAQLLFDFKGIIDEVTYKILLKLRESIEREVYDAGTPSPNDGYRRLKYMGGLIGSFEKLDTNILGRTVEGSIKQDPMTMVNDPDNFTHGSNFWNVTDDIRTMLSDIIIGGKSGDLFGPGFWRSPRDFWTPIIEMLTNGEVDKLIENAMTTRGIIWRKF